MSALSLGAPNNDRFQRHTKTRFSNTFRNQVVSGIKKKKKVCQSVESKIDPNGRRIFDIRFDRSATISVVVLKPVSSDPLASGFRRPSPPSPETYDNVRFSFVQEPSLARSIRNQTDGLEGEAIRSVTVL